jgi:putative Mg2+ transporter-C (MgtC) family protein
MELITDFYIANKEYISIVIRLVVAVILGGLIGIEREGTHHAAGLRTHIVVCLGAAGITALSHILILDGYTTDISRFGAQVVSGIGFLGAGCIMVNNNKVKGLTTAAGLWTTACVGLATGLGYYVISVTITLLVVLAMLVLHPIGKRLAKIGKNKKEQVLVIKVKNRQSFQTITECAIEQECNIVKISTLEEDCFKVTIGKNSEEIINAFIGSLMEHKDIKDITKN